MTIKGYYNAHVWKWQVRRSKRVEYVFLWRNEKKEKTLDSRSCIIILICNSWNSVAFGATEKYVKMPVSPTFVAKSGQIWGDFIEKLELRQASGLQVLDKLAYKSSSNCSRARNASGRFFMFSAAKAWIIASESEREWELQRLGFRSFYEIT